jgi:hypothetical protein
MNLDERWLATLQKGNLIRLFNLEWPSGNGTRGHQQRCSCPSARMGLAGSRACLHSPRLAHCPRKLIGSPLEHRLPVIRVTLTGDGQQRSPARLSSSSPEAANESQAWMFHTPTSQRLIKVRIRGALCMDRCDRNGSSMSVPTTSIHPRNLFPDEIRVI